MWETVKNKADGIRWKRLSAGSIDNRTKWLFGSEVPNRNGLNDYPIGNRIATGVGLQMKRVRFPLIETEDS